MCAITSESEINSKPNLFGILVSHPRGPEKSCHGHKIQDAFLLDISVCVMVTKEHYGHLILATQNWIGCPKFDLHQTWPLQYLIHFLCPTSVLNFHCAEVNFEQEEDSRRNQHGPKINIEET